MGIQRARTGVQVAGSDEVDDKLVEQIEEIGGWVESTRKTFEKADLDWSRP